MDDVFSVFLPEDAISCCRCNNHTTNIDKLKVSPFFQRTISHSSDFRKITNGNENIQISKYLKCDIF